MPKFITAVLRTKTTLEFRAATANSPLDAALQDGEVVEEHVITDNQKIVSNQMRDEAATEEWHEKICKDNGVRSAWFLRP